MYWLIGWITTLVAMAYAMDHFPPVLVISVVIGLIAFNAYTVLRKKKTESVNRG